MSAEHGIQYMKIMKLYEQFRVFFPCLQNHNLNRPTHQVLIMLGNALCETLNGINNNTACVEKDNLY